MDKEGKKKTKRIAEFGEYFSPDPSTMDNSPFEKMENG